MEQKPPSWHYHANSPTARKVKRNPAHKAKTAGSNPGGSVPRNRKSPAARNTSPSSAPKKRKPTTGYKKSQRNFINWDTTQKRSASPKTVYRSAGQSVRRPKKSSAAIAKAITFVCCVFLVSLAVWMGKSSLINVLDKPVDGVVDLGGNNGQEIGSCVIRSGGDLIPPEIEQPLKQWFVTSFNATATLSNPDLTSLYAKDDLASESRLIDETALSYISKVRSMQAVDLKLTGFEIGLTITDCSTDENGNYVVTLMEDDQVQFACLKGQTSSSCDIYNTFTFSPNGLILSHEKTEDGFTLIRDMYENQYSGSAQQTLNQILDSLVQTAQQNIDAVAKQRSSYATDIEAIESQAPAVDYSYNRAQAVSYAHQWVGTTAPLRNSEWGMYDDYGGNCNNFTSQCLHAGGIPMDVYGSDTQQWKWYGEQSNTQNQAAGRSSSWSGVDEFYTYVTENSGYGLVAQTGINIFAAQPGDVIQYGADGEWKHSVLVVDVLKDENGQPLDLLIASNTTDRIEWPMSAYAYTDIRLIHVLGYDE